MHHVRVCLKLDKAIPFAWCRHAWLSSIPSHTQYRQSRQGTNFFQHVDVSPTVHDYAGWLKGCTHSLSLIRGHVIHADTVHGGLESHPVIGSALVNLYSKCGNLEDACKVFDMVSAPDVVLWSAIIVACANHQHAEKGLRLFERMQLEEGLSLDKQVLMYALKACAGVKALEEGRRIHIIITKQGLEADEFVGNGLVDMYCKSGSIKDAHRVFDNFVVRDVVLWTSIICGYAESSLITEAFKLYWEMQKEGVEPNTVMYECIIRACSSLGDAQEGEKIFADMMKLGVFDSHVGVALVRMYCNVGKLDDAQKVFSTLNAQDVVCWTMLITGYAEQGQGKEALGLYQSMRKGGIKPDEAIFVCILKVCSQFGAFREGQIIYFDMILEGFDSSLCVKQSLMDMYIRCASLEDAHTIFENLPVRDVVSCSAIIAGYALHGYDMKSLELFEDMQLADIHPNEITYTSILKACARLKKLECGKLIHTQLVFLGFENDLFIRSALIDMYAGGRRLEEACTVFNKLPPGGDVVMWNTMIGVYVEHDQNKQALRLYAQMCDQGVGSGYVTFLWVIRACSDIEQGRVIHALAVKQGCDMHTEVQNTLIGMYYKMGTLDDAHAIFKRLARRTLQSCNALLTGHSFFGHIEQALQIYHRMNDEGIKQDGGTYVSMLKICAAIGGLHIGRLIYTAIAHDAMDCEPFLASTVVDFFAKAGSLRDTVHVFNRLRPRDAATWNALMAAYADNGCIEDAEESFSTMQEEGVEPGSRTFLCLLNASTHAGNTASSYHYFQNMRDYGIVPNSQHFACLIDALGRAGLLKEANMLTLMMPTDPSAVAWTTLSGSFFKHGFLDQRRLKNALG